MFCPKCGTFLQDDAVMCNQCGAEITSTSARAASPQPAATHVPNYLVFAILVTILCCLPAGIPAIVYSSQVNAKLQAGDVNGAKLASQNAKMWCWIAFGGGLAIGIGYFLIFILGMMGNRHF